MLSNPKNETVAERVKRYTQKMYNEVRECNRKEEGPNLLAILEYSDTCYTLTRLLGYALVSSICASKDVIKEYGMEYSNTLELVLYLMLESKEV
jgi:hypothetical protein